MLSPENGHSRESVWIINRCVFEETCNGNFWIDRDNGYRETSFLRKNGHGLEQVIKSEGGLRLLMGNKIVGEICEVVTDTGALVMQISVNGECSALISQLEKTGWIRV